MPSLFTPFLWVAITLPVLIILQRWIHRHLHGLSLLLTGNPHWAVIVYALILLPGVALHEFSHWITAKILSVRTGRFSIIPKKQANGVIQLGYVEFYKNNVGPIRESLIGGAPMVFGTLAILGIGLLIFDMPAIAATIGNGGVENLTNGLTQLFQTSDFLVWLYLLFAIGNAMLPSPSDRRAWPAFFGLLALLIVILFLFGFQNILLNGLTGPVALIFSYLGLALSLAIAVDLLFILIIFMIEEGLTRIKQVEIVYGSKVSQKKSLS